MAGFVDYESYDAVGLADLVRRRKVTPTELLNAAIARVEARNPALNCVILPLYDYARKAIADGLPDGPLCGVPYLLKDLTASLAGARTMRGSRFFADTPPAAADSEHVARLKQAGLVIFGRTSTCELGLSLTCESQLYGPTRNPWDLTRISGGSSGGAAAAVGGRTVPIAHASDGFGSIRVPAACCGLVGLKPTRARNTMAPYAGEGLGGLSTEHAVTLSVRDCAALLDATAGPGPGDPYAAPPAARPFLEEAAIPPQRLRVAWTVHSPNAAPVDPACVKLVRDIAALAAGMGHEVIEADPEIEHDAVIPTFMTLVAANSAVNVRTHPTIGRAPRRGEVENATFDTAARGERIAGPDYVRAIQTAHRLGRQMAAFHQHCDVLLTPALATPGAVKLGWLDMMLEDVDEYWRRVFAFSPFTVLFNITGQPAITLPVGRAEALGTSAGLPLAVQLVARFGDEATLFRLAAQMEAALPWFERKPVLMN